MRSSLTFSPSVRLRFFNQLEDELQSHQHEAQWLREKGNQLAQKDAELAGEVLREIGLLETTWEDTKRLITEKYWSKPNTLLTQFNSTFQLSVGWGGGGE